LVATGSERLLLVIRAKKVVVYVRFSCAASSDCVLLKLMDTTFNYFRSSTVGDKMFVRIRLKLE
jgi:hypothetical protein